MPIDKNCAEDVRVFLRSLPKDTVMDLAKTVTSQRIQFTSTDEAIEGIIDFSISPKELLQRRRMKVDFLFAYLVNFCQVNVPFRSSKSDLVDKILEKWQAVQFNDDFEEASSDSGDAATSSQPKADEAKPEQPSVSAEMRALAVAFLNWWYTMLKPVAGCDASNGQSTFGPQHFFGDCTFNLYCMSEDGQFQHEEHIRGSQPVFMRFHEIVSSLKMILNPNLTSPSSIKCFADPHGLVFIGVMGTLFVSPSTVGGDNTLAGVFEQSFGIVQDPLNDNNWVVKFSQLRLSANTRYVYVFQQYFGASNELLGSGDVPALMDV